MKRGIGLPRAIVRSQLEFVRVNPGLPMILMSRELHTRSELLRAGIAGLMEMFHRHLAGVFEEGKRNGEFAADLDDSIVQLHSSAYRNPDQLQPGPALVVGAGNSGAEIALDIMNIGNLINKDWGLIDDYGFYSTRRVANYAGINPETGKYVYNFSGSTDNSGTDGSPRRLWASSA